ncbi:MAG: sigma-E processing peptidase SpoIIGA, partial [Clostridia bacterium]
MKVYVENVIIDNMVFDCILLALTAFTLRQKIVWWRILLGGVIGTALVFPVTLIDCIYAQYVIKLCSLALMNLVNTTKLSFKRFIWSTLFFVAYTFILGGAIIGLFFLLGIDFTNTSTFNYISDIPIGLYALAVALIAYLAFAIRKYTLEKKKRSAFLCKCRVSVSDKVVECDGYFDSGNTLMHLETPVCFSTSKSLTRLLSEVLAESVLHS